MKISTRCAALLLAAVAGIAGAEAAVAQVGTPVLREQRTIRVAGSGEYRTSPDMATVMFAAETTGATAQEAGAANAELMDAVIRALLGAGVTRDDIETSGYSLFPEYARPPRGDETAPPEIRGYRASNQISVETRDLERVGALIDVGLNAGANRLNGVSFSLQDAAAAQAAALRDAVLDARAAAETMATALGVTLGPVLDASTSAQPVQPYYRAVAMEAMRMDGAMAAPPTPIEPGEQTVHATASLVFAIE